MAAYLVALGTFSMIYGLMALALCLQWGQTGLPNFGLAASFAIGSYAAALAGLNGWPTLLGMVLAAGSAGLAAYPLGLLTIRLREDYLALAAIGFSEVVRLALENEEWLTNGPSGLAGIPRLFPHLPAGPRETFTLVVLAATVVVAFGLLQRLAASPFGRTLRAIRNDEVAAQSLGKDVVRFKLTSLVVGSGLVGLAGSFYAYHLTFISPEQFSPIVTFHVWIAVILGGSSRYSGALLGTMVLLTFLEGTRFLNDFGISMEQSRLASLRLVIVGMGLVTTLLYRPDGLLALPQARPGEPHGRPVWPWRRAVGQQKPVGER